MPFGFYFLKPKEHLASVKDWLNEQSHYEDAIFYLIEKEIYENGLRDLSYTIPRMRNDAYFEELFFKTNARKENKISQQYTKPMVPEEIRPKLKVVSTNTEQISQSLSKSMSKGSISTTSLGNVDLACYDD